MLEKMDGEWLMLGMCSFDSMLSAAVVVFVVDEGPGWSEEADEEETAPVEEDAEERPYATDGFFVLR